MRTRPETVRTAPHDPKDDAAMGMLEERRAEALASLGVWDSPGEDLLERVVSVAAALTGRAMAAVSLSDRERQVFLAEVGLGVSEVPADLAFCRFVSEADVGGMEVTDATKDPRFAANPLVTQSPGIRSYAGVPLTLDTGVSVGTLCVMDTRPGALTVEQRTALRTLADTVTQLLQARRVVRDLAETLRDRDEAEEGLRAAMREIRTVFDGVPEGLILTDADGTIQRVNQAFADLVGVDETAFVGRRWDDLLDAEERADEARLWEDLRSDRRATVVREITLPRPVAGRGPVLASTSVARRSDGTLGSVVTRVEDIASRRQAEIGLREAQSALDGIVTVDGSERIVSWNEGASRLFGYDRSAAMGKDLALIVPGYAHEAHAHGFARLHNGGEPRLLGTTVELEALTADGSLLPIELALSRWYRGDEPFYTAVIRDVSERRRHESELQWRATHDEATGLPNMGALGRWYDENCAPLSDGRLRAVFCLQLTNLSSVSAALGSEASTELLNQIGMAFRAASRSDLLICHLRDTHFGGAVILEGGAYPSAFIRRLEAIARYVIDAGTGPYLLDHVRVEINVQIGVVATGVTGLSFLELLRHAEATRDSSPRHINVAPQIHSAADPTAARNLATLSDLHDAVPHQQLELHYQPLTPLQPRQVSRDGAPAAAAPQMVEALLRWRHPTRGLVSPGQFIPLIETSRLMFDVTDWVLHEALTQQAHWHEAGLDVRVAVNVSPQVLLNGDIVAMVRKAIDASGANPDRVKVEITESAIVDNPDQARGIVADLRRLGVHVSLDDFGTGYTSLRFLRDFAVDEIKLDRLFVANSTTNPADAAIANVVGQLGQRLGIRTVAEGIEEVETRSLFRAFGYDYMQGYLDSRPLPAAEIELWLRRHRVETSHPSQPGAPTSTRYSPVGREQVPRGPAAPRLDPNWSAKCDGSMLRNPAHHAETEV